MRNVRAAHAQSAPAATASHEPCDLCGAACFETIANRDRRGLPLETCLCTRCGLVRHARLPSEQDLAEFYAREYRQAYHGETTPSPRRVLRAWRVGGKLLRQLRPFLRPRASVFEVGAGIGCTVKQFELAGFDASGIEPGEGFCGYARQVLGAAVAQQELSSVPQTAQYDLVLLVHVIEHLRSPSKALEHIRGLLRPEGRLYVECPNLYAPFAVRSRLFHAAHIHNFTPFTLRMMAERCGFLVERTFGDERAPNLCFLLKRAVARQTRIDPASCARTRECLSRHNWLTYHLRWRYLAARVRKLGAYAYERLAARREVQRIIARCAQSPTPQDARTRAA